MEEKSSTHKCEVIKVKLEQHPNADTLSIVQVFGYTVCVRTSDWQDGMLGAYVVPDSLVPLEKPEFKFLDPGKGKSHERIKAKRLRGVVSYGLLIKAPEGSQEGDDVSDALGILRYEAPIHVDRTGYCSTKTDHVPGPDVPFSIPKYDVDAFQRYAKSMFVEGELVYVSEKVDGANSRFMFDGTRMHIGSRNLWCKEEGNSLWHKALQRRPEIETFCRNNPNCVLYGEVFGYVQDLRYGMNQGEVDFVAFDVLKDGKWMDVPNMIEVLSANGVPIAPSFGCLNYNFEELMALAEGPSCYPGAQHYREGIVVKTVKERWSHAGRAQLKIVSVGYLENSGKEKPWKPQK
jgi:RNA ligase (TIGR02306 family)